MKTPKGKGPSIVMRVPVALENQVRKLIADYSKAIEGEARGEVIGQGVNLSEGPQERLQAMLTEAYERGVTYGAGFQVGVILAKARQLGHDITSQSKALALARGAPDEETAAIWESGVKEGLEEKQN